jgi:hypothetical protein
MKKIKLVLAFAALLAIPTVFAFTQQNREVKEWEYDGTGDTLEPENYQEVSSSPSCAGVNEICTVIAPDDGNGMPDLSDPDLQNRITQKITTQGDVFLRN